MSHPNLASDDENLVPYFFGGEVAKLHHFHANGKILASMTKDGCDLFTERSTNANEDLLDAGVNFTLEESNRTVMYNPALRELVFVWGGYTDKGEHKEKTLRFFAGDLFGLTEDEQKIVSALDGGKKVVVCGPRRCGATSLVRRALRGRYLPTWHGFIGGQCKKLSTRNTKPKKAEFVDVFDNVIDTTTRRAARPRTGKPQRKAVYICTGSTPPSSLMEGAVVVACPGLTVSADGYAQVFC